MALLLGDAAEALSIPSRATSPIGISDSLFQEATALITSNNRHMFRSVGNLVKFLVAREKCYMLIYRVSASSLSKIEKGLEKRGLRKQLRFTYETASESLIIKCMPGVAHDLTAWEFVQHIRAKVAQLPGHSLFSVCAVGTAEFRSPRMRKQGDCGLKPTTRTLGSDWPSLMIEVGFSQSLSSLRIDAKIWLVCSAGKTKIVIIIEIANDKSALHFERWEMVPNTTARVTRSTPPLVPKALQAFQILANGTVTPPGSQLLIPYLKLFDNPDPNAADFPFTTNDLLAIGQHIFGLLQ